MHEGGGEPLLLSLVLLKPNIIYCHIAIATEQVHYLQASYGLINALQPATTRTSFQVAIRFGTTRLEVYSLFCGLQSFQSLLSSI